MLDKIKQEFQNLVSNVKKNQPSKFFEKGILNPEEFMKSGDKLISLNPMWSWYKGDCKENTNLSKEK